MTSLLEQFLCKLIVLREFSEKTHFLIAINSLDRLERFSVPQGLLVLSHGLYSDFVGQVEVN